MKFKDKVTNLLDNSQNRVDNLIKRLENNTPITREELIRELNFLAKNITYLSDTVSLEDNDFAALEGRMR